MSAEDKAKFVADLERPPSGEDPSYVSEEAAADDFAAWKAAAGAGGRGVRSSM